MLPDGKLPPFAVKRLRERLTGLDPRTMRALADEHEHLSGSASSSSVQFLHLDMAVLLREAADVTEML